MMKSSRIVVACIAMMSALCGSAYAESDAVQRISVVDGYHSLSMSDLGYGGLLIVEQSVAAKPDSPEMSYDVASTGGSTMSMLSNQFIANSSGASFKGVQPITSASISSGYTS